VEAFLRRVLPDGGRYVVTVIPPGAKAQEIWALASIKALVTAAQRLSLSPVNVYYAVGTYGVNGRNEPKAKRCLFLDLDPKQFGTKQNALTQLGIFLRAVGFPAPSIYVDSGRGIHAYWTFSRDLDVASWLELASRLKQTCEAAGFHADPTVTADAKRILRLPGTLNHNAATPLPCRVLRDTGIDFDPATLLQALQPRLSNALSKLAALVGPNDLGSVPELSSYPQVPYYATEIAEKCGVMKEALETGGRDHTEPQWRHLLGLLAFCDDGENLVHKISEGHPGYSAEQTDKKFARILLEKSEARIKPILCTTFATYKNSICSGCPYNGRIKTPMVLGKLEATAFLPYNYRLGDYSVQRLTKKAAGPDDPDVWTDVFPYRISDVEVLDPGHRAPMQVRAIYSGKKDVHKVDFPHVLLSSGQNDGLAEEFAAHRLWVTSNQISEFKNFMTTWLRRMSDIKAAVAVDLHGLGWGMRSGKHAFVAGPNVYTDDGKEHDFYFPDAAVLRNYIPVGDPAVWTKAATALASDPRPAAVTTLLTSFAAPLVAFAGVKGLTFSLYSADTGTGKSSILRTAQAVWGHPTRGMAMIDDTQLSVINRLGFLNTIPAYWDELRSSDTFFNFVKMIFTLGQGREKSRLTSGIKQQATGTWDTLVTLASNERIADHVDAHIKNSDAGRVRLFEVVLPSLVSPDPSLRATFAALEKNYGHAGQRYAKYLVMHRAEAERIVKTYVDELSKKSPGTGERFWIAFISVILASALLVERSGILKVDRTALQKYLLTQLVIQRHGSQQEYSAPAESCLAALFQFVDSHRSNMLLVETLYGTGLSKYGNILTPMNQLPREDILILKSRDDHMLRISRHHWRKWVQEVLKSSPTTLETELVKKGAVVRRLALSAGIEAASGARVPCIEVDLTLPAFAELQIDQ
jgi:hypothetical protein